MANEAYKPRNKTADDAVMQLGLFLVVTLSHALVGTNAWAALPSPMKHQLYSANQCGGPATGWQEQGSEFGELLVVNLLQADSNGVIWNGDVVTEPKLRGLLEGMAKLPVRPSLSVVFGPNTDCTVVVRLRQIIAERLQCGQIQTCVEYSDAEWADRQPAGRGWDNP